MTNHQAFFRLVIIIGCQTLAGACSKSQSVELATDTTLLPNRPLVLRATHPLRVVGSINQLCLKIRFPDALNDPPSNYEWGVRRADGVLVKVGAAMLHADNSADTISSVGYSTSSIENCLTIGPSIYDSLHLPFVAVRITVTDSLRVSKVTWNSWTGL